MTTKIEWVQNQDGTRGKTWNPVRGCSRVSPGCDNCYAMGQAHRFSGAGKPYEGLTTLRKGKVDWSGVARFVPEMLDVPLRTRKPTTWFVNSMSDLFHHSVTNEQIAAIFGVMAACPQHTFQVLTKRAERMREWFEWYEGSSGAGASAYAAAMTAVEAYSHPSSCASREWFEVAKLAPWPLQNVWLMVSAEDQPRADERIPHLLATPAAVRGVSAEPLLGPIDFNRGLNFGVQLADGSRWFGSKPGIDWVIVGGESGHGARGCDAAWIRSIVEQCRAANVSVFVKQLGAHAIDLDYGLAPLLLTHKKGGAPAEWPADLRVRQMPEARS